MLISLSAALNMDLNVSFHLLDLYQAALKLFAAQSVFLLLLGGILFSSILITMLWSLRCETEQHLTATTDTIKVCVTEAFGVSTQKLQRKIADLCLFYLCLYIYICMPVYIYV